MSRVARDLGANLFLYIQADQNLVMVNRFLVKSDYRLLTIVGGIIFFCLISLGVVFFQILKSTHLEAQKQILFHQTEFVGKAIEREFARFQEDADLILTYIESKDPKGNQEVILPIEVKKIVNSFPGLVDTLWIDFGDSVRFFSFSPQNEFIEGNLPKPTTYYGGISQEVRGKSGQSIIYGLDIENFSGKVIADVFSTPEVWKYLWSDYKLIGLGNYPSEKELRASDLEQVLNDAYLGQKGSYQVTWNVGESEVSGILTHIPLTMNFPDLRLSLVFFAPMDYNGVANYSQLIYLFLVLLVVFFGIILFLAVFVKKKLIHSKTKETIYREISDLFEQQNLLLKELRGFVFFHTSNLDIQRVSEEVQHVLGFSEGQLISEFQGQPKHPLVIQIKEELSRAVREKKEFVDLESDLIRGDGGKIRVRIFEKFIFDPFDRFKGGMGICYDITEQYQSRLEIIQSENRLRSLIDNLPDIIFIYDNEGRVIDVHLQGKEHLLKTANNTKGRKLEEFISPNQLNEILSAFRKARNSGKIQTATATWEDEYDGMRHYEIRFFPLDQDQMISISKDVTSQKIWENGLVEAMNAADFASKAKSEFLANMSHEIRTPMNGLLGIIDLLEGTTLNKVQRQYVEIIKNSGNSLLTIIQDILDYSKIESGKIEIQHNPFNPVAEVKSQMEILMGVAGKKKISLDFVYSKEAEVTLEGDKGKINQILLNLIGNALKFTPEKGKVNVKLDLEEFSDHLVYLHYQVSDTGIGISEENVKHLTRPFYQVESTNTKAYQGTGLGLAIAKKLVELMGGEFTIQSQLGKGSTFSFYILLKRVTESVTKTLQPVLSWKHIREMGAEFPLRILLAEDNELNLQLMTMMFEQLGFEFEVAKNGKEVVEMVKNGSFDVVLMDVQMPLINGLEATRQIRNLPGKKELIIIGLSANVFEEDERIALSYGMNDYLTKPIRLTVLADKLEYYFRKVRGKTNP